MLRGLSVSLLLAVVTVVGCSNGKSSGDAPGAMANEIPLPSGPPAGPVPIPYPNVNAPAEQMPAAVAAPTPSPDTVAAPAPTPSGHKGKGQAAGKRQHAPIQ